MNSEIQTTADHVASEDDEPIVVPPDEVTRGYIELDPRFVGLSRLEAGIVYAIILTVAVIGGSILFRVIPFPFLLLIPVAWMLIAAVSLLSTVWWPKWEHARWTYRIDDDVVELRYGVVWRTAVLIPRSRLQHVDLHQGPLERRWGLATVEIHTAGTRNASHKIPGLDVEVANALRDQLITASNRASHDADEH